LKEKTQLIQFFFSQSDDYAVGPRGSDATGLNLPLYKLRKGKQAD